MIQDIEEESKTKFSMDVEFSFSFKALKLSIIKCIETHTILWYYFLVLNFVLVFRYIVLVGL